MFSYSSIVGMFVYLWDHNRPYIAFTFDFCAQYMFLPKRPHDFSLKRLARYLNHTKYHGLVLDLNSYIFKVDAYPGAEFAGIYGHKNSDDQACSKSCTGFIITFSGCPVLCISRLQTETALYTMEAEIISLASCCQELFRIIGIDKYLGKSVGLLVGVTLMKVYVQKDKSGSLILARTFPSKFTPRGKYYATKAVFFWEYIKKSSIALLKIAIVEHLGDLFTKGLPRATLEYLWNKFMGW